MLPISWFSGFYLLYSHIPQLYLLRSAFLYHWGIMILLKEDYAHTCRSEPSKNKSHAMSQPSISLLYEYVSYLDWSQIQSAILIINLLPRISVLWQASTWQRWWDSFLYLSWLSGMQFFWAWSQSFWSDPWIPFCPLLVNTAIQIKAKKCMAGHWKKKHKAYDVFVPRNWK